MGSTLDKAYVKVMNKVIWNSIIDNHDVIELDDLSNIWTELEEKLKDDLEKIRFIKYYDESIISKISKHAKEIKNPYTGGDNDFIIYDIWNGEYTYGESGELPLCDLETLEESYKDKTLEEIIKITYSC